MLREESQFERLLAQQVERDAKHGRIKGKETSIEFDVAKNFTEWGKSLFIRITMLNETRTFAEL